MQLTQYNKLIHLLVQPKQLLMSHMYTIVYIWLRVCSHPPEIAA